MRQEEFKKIIWENYWEMKRDLPWRKTKDAYKILVSEIMLQQTQSARVVEKYTSFLKKFPTVFDVANASLSDVLKEWQGLGYNRRALYLKSCCEWIATKNNGKFPKSMEELCALPGIGKATAGDILAFAHNIPSVFIETNIRSVFIHFFFKDDTKVHDKDILPLIEKTLDTENPREWYWALFDYGTKLKKEGNPSRKSVHHKRQTKFIGSNRQKRAHILRIILEKSQTEKQIIEITKYDPELVSTILTSLEKEKMIKKVKDNFKIV